MSDVARRLPQYDFRMTVRQKAKIRPKMMKYWRQLLEEIEAKGGQVRYGAKARKSVKAEEAMSTPYLPAPVAADQPAHYGAW